MVTGAGHVQLDEAPMGEFPRVELATGISGLGVVPEGTGTTAEVWPMGELPKELDTGTEAGGAKELTGTEAAGAEVTGTASGVEVVTGGAGVVETTGTRLVVT